MYKGTECVSYRDYFTFQQSEYNCYLSSSSHTGVVIKAKTEENQDIINNLASFTVALSGDGSSVVVGSGSSQLPKNGEFYAYKISSGFTPLSAKVYPVLKSGKMCGASDIIKILSCSPSITFTDFNILWYDKNENLPCSKERVPIAPKPGTD